MYADDELIGEITQTKFEGKLPIEHAIDLYDRHLFCSMLKLLLKHG